MGLFIDGWPGLAVPISQAPKSYPLRKYGDIAHSVYVRRYRQRLANFMPTQAGAEDALASGFYLIDETTPEVIGADIAEFSRTYANVPSQTIDFQPVKFTRPKISASSTNTNYGSETTGNAGMIYKPSLTGSTVDLYRRRAVASDNGASNTPTGGSYTITTPVGTTAAIAYNASAATALTALQAVSGIGNYTCSLSASNSANYAFMVKVAPKRPSITLLSGAGLTAGAFGDQYYVGTSRLSVPAATVDISGVTFSVPDTLLTGVYVYKPSGVFYETDTSGYDHIVISPPVYRGTYASGESGQSIGVISGGHIKLISNGVTSSNIAVGPSTAECAATRTAIITAYAAAWSPNVVTVQAGISNTYIGTLQGIQFDPSANSTNLGLLYYDCLIISGITRPWVYAAAPASWSFKIGYSGDEATLTETVTEATLTAAISGLAYFAATGITPEIYNYTKLGTGVQFSVRIPTSVALSFTSSLTPTPSSVTVLDKHLVADGFYSSDDGYANPGYYHYSLYAGTTERRIVTSSPHGIAAGDSIYIKQGTYKYDIKNFVIADAYTLLCSNKEAPFSTSTAITELGPFVTRYAAGTVSVMARITTDYFLPGVTTGIASVGDIPIISANLTDDEIIDAMFSTSGDYMAIEESELETYLGPIMSRKTKAVKFR